MLVGPQGAGKTTVAAFLAEQLRRRGLKISFIKLIDYTIFYTNYLKLINWLSRNNVVFLKFYENLPPQRSAPSYVFRRLAPLCLFLHIIGLFISLIKAHFIRSCGLCDIIIEDEGFIFKQLGDLFTHMSFIGSWKDKISMNLANMLLKLSIVSLRTFLGAGICIININAPYETLRERYGKRGIIEPRKYVELQSKINRILLHYLNILYRGNCLIIDIDTTNLHPRHAAVLIVNKLAKILNK